MDLLLKPLFFNGLHVKIDKGENMKIKQILTDVSNFKDFIESGGYYSDKTALIKEWVEASGKFTLITRPRRFGKTLILSMLKYFFSNKEDSKHLFEGLEVSEDMEFCKEHMNKYPVISITFKDVKASNWEELWQETESLLADLYKENKEVLTSLDENEKEYFESISGRKADKTDYRKSLFNLSIYLEKHYGKKVMLLIDEYDTPIHESFVHGYYEDAMKFYGLLYAKTLKENPGVEKSLTTGILRVSKESMFRGMNNLTVLTILEEQYGQYLGFSEEETKKMLSYFGREDRFEEVLDWYNGYKFGNHIMYNPWSVSNFSKTGVLKEYWINTGNANVLYKVIGLGDDELKDGIPKLLSGEEIKTTIEENISFEDILTKSEAAYGVLLFAGYLSWSKSEIIDEKLVYSLRIPNLEVKAFLKSLVPRVTEQYVRGSNRLFDSLEKRDWESFRLDLVSSVISSSSFHDIPADESEKVYHMFMLGMLVMMDIKYEVRSNRESGIGRYDIALYPRDKSNSGIIFEFKQAGSAENMKKAAKDALQQIKDRKYEQDFIDRGIKEVHKVGVAFRGKEVEIEHIL